MLGLAGCGHGRDVDDGLMFLSSVRARLFFCWVCVLDSPFAETFAVDGVAHFPAEIYRALLSMSPSTTTFHGSFCTAYRGGAYGSIRGRIAITVVARLDVDQRGLDSTRLDSTRT